MNKVLCLLVLSVGVSSPTLGQQSPRASDSRTRDIYVSVVDSKGSPVKGLTAADFTVREDGVSREVLKVRRADTPPEIILLVDDSQAASNAIPHLRDGLNRFIDLMKGQASIGIVTIGERPTTLVERTKDVEAQKKAVGRIFARSGTGAYLLEGIHDVSRGFQKRNTERPILIALTTEGVEFSNLQAQNVLKDLHASGATLHVLAIGSPSGSTTDEMRNRNIVLADGTEQTGGQREQLLSEMAIPTMLERLAHEILNQYVVTYGRPEALIPPERVEVTTTRSGATARARTRLPAR